MYHWRVETISSGRSPFSKNLTACVNGLGSPIELAGLAAAARRCAFLALKTVLPASSAYAALRGIRHDHIGGVGEHAAVLAEDRAVGQVELAPPDDVGHVAERADHRDARALVLLRERVGEHGHLDVEQRRAHRRAEQRLVALVVGVGDERHARGEQLGARRLDVHVAGAVGLVERDAVVGGGLLAVLELGLRDRGAEVDVPQRRRERLVRLAALEVAQEGELARADRVVRDRAVGLRPVDAQTRAGGTAPRTASRPRRSASRRAR